MPPGTLYVEQYAACVAAKCEKLQAAGRAGEAPETVSSAEAVTAPS
jgi:hypothetical protein